MLEPRREEIKNKIEILFKKTKITDEELEQFLNVYNFLSEDEWKKLLLKWETTNKLQ